MSEYQAIVIGSGFGGAVAACRLAQAGLSVCLLERGKRYGAGEGLEPFPRGFERPLEDWLWGGGGGLFDVRPFHEVQTVQAAGYGGGSLVYANVHLRAPAELFDQGWPAGYSRAALDPYYELVAHMLDLQPAPEGFAPKTLEFERAAAQLGRADQCFRPPLAVSFTEPDRDFTNKFGATQSGCTGCGECDIGCTYGAKNTLDRNYLHVAERHGARVRTSTEVSRIARRHGGGYAVTCADPADPDRGCELTAERVFICAGALGSTELLLRCRQEHGTLHALSDRLGERYWANGDNIALLFDAAASLDPSVGPTISTATVYRGGPQGAPLWFMLQEGGYPAALWPLLRMLAPDVPERGSLRKASAVLLLMGRDLVPGRLRLTPLPGLRDPLNIDWDYGANSALYDAQHRLLRDIAGALGGRLVPNAVARQLHVPVSVHNLGGCPMADDAASGVVDGWGEVYNYPGLYVLDGAAIPVSLGVNPSHTIAAVAERNVEHHIRRILDQPRWCPPEAAAVQPFHDPLDDCDLDGVPPLEAPAAGIGFREAMHGWHAPRPAGAPNSAPAELRLEIRIPDLSGFLADRYHRGIVTGTVGLGGLTPPGGSAIDAGSFELFTSPPDTGMYQRQMRYELGFLGSDGRRYVLEGRKVARDDRGPDLWRDLTTLHFEVHAGAVDGPPASTGKVRLGLGDFIKQLTTIRTRGVQGPWHTVTTSLRFLRYFLGGVWDVYVRAKLASHSSSPATDPAFNAAPPLSLRSAPEGIQHRFNAPDGMGLILTRFEAGPKGPVILAHGAGVWSGTFTIQTTQTNFVKALMAEGYDVWVLDWRASIRLPLTQFTLDEVAENDHPAAVDYVLNASGADSVQVIGHCMGANTLMQSAALGLLRDKVRCLGLSALALHYEAPWITDLKARAFLPEIFARLGIDYFSCRQHPEHARLHEIWACLVDLCHPECDSRTCHRASFMYGTPYLHANLNRQTHDRLEEQFGALNMTTFRHIAQNLRRGTASRFDYGDAENMRRYGTRRPPTYLDAAHLDLPITLITGRQNRLWQWPSMYKTYRWLCRHRDPGLYRLHILENYGHQDMFWGVDAPREVYPLWLDFLDKHP